MPLKDKRSWKYLKSLFHLSLDVGYIFVGIDFTFFYSNLWLQLAGLVITLIGLFAFTADIKSFEEI